MQTFIEGFNILLSILTVIAQVIVLIAILAIWLREIPAFLKPVSSFLTKRAMLISFLAALAPTIGSLIYSDIIGYEPCKLCWFQRIFMYPLVIILGMALWKKDVRIRAYAMVLASIGGLIALFHYAGQLGWNPLGLECLAIGYSASCAKNFVLQFGYITIPLMAFSAFALIVFTLALSLKADKEETLVK